MKPAIINGMQMSLPLPPPAEELAQSAQEQSVAPPA